MANTFNASYILPVHHDLPYSEADPAELNGQVAAKVLDDNDWHHFYHKLQVKG
jgi:hypothetical protein